MKKINHICILIIFLLGIGMLAGCSSNETASKEQNNTVKIGWQPSMEIPFYIAQKEELFEKNNIKPEYTKFTAGPPMFAALSNGSVDVTYMGTPPSVIAMAENLPVSIIAVEVDASNGEGLVVNPKSGIKSLKDLKGKKISVLRGSSSEYAMLEGLKQAGLTPDDLTIIDLDVTTIMPAYEKGDVDGVWVWDPWASKLISAGGELIARNSDVGVGSAGVWVARNEWIEKNPEDVKAFLKGLVAANKIMHEDKDLSVSILQEALSLEKQDAESVLTNSYYPTTQDLKDPNYQFSMNSDAIKQNEGLAKVLNHLTEFLIEKDKISQKPNVEEHINGSFVEELQN